MESPLSARWRAESTAVLCAASGSQQSFGRRMQKVFLKSNVACSHDHDDKVHSLCCHSLAFYLPSAAQLKVVPGWIDYICCQKQPFATQTANCQTQTKPFDKCCLKKHNAQCGRATLRMSWAFQTRLCCCWPVLCLDGAQNGSIDRCAV